LGAFAGYDAAVLRLYTEGPRPEAVLAFGSWVKAALALAAVGCVGATIAFARGARFAGVATLALSTLAAIQVATAGFDALSGVRSTSAILRSAQSGGPLAPGAPFYQLHMYDHTAPFYLDRPTVPVAYRDELGPGIDAEPERAIPTVAAWRTLWSGLAQGYAMMPPHVYAELAGEGVPMRVLARDASRVVVSRR
jgi:hypothetical protein